MWNETKIRVRYAETDKMGVVHHANYYVWFELGRSSYCRTKGFSYSEMEDEDNTRLVVAASSCRYKSPAFYDDELTVRTQIAQIRSRSIIFVFEIYRESDKIILAVGETKHIVTDTNNRVSTFPQKYKDLLLEVGGS